MVIKGDVFYRMDSISTYFKEHSVNNVLFQPEAEASTAVNSLIETLVEINKDDIQKILNIINGVEVTEHSNGTGWMDYKMHLASLLRQNGFEVDGGYSGKMKLK